MTDLLTASSTAIYPTAPIFAAVEPLPYVPKAVDFERAAEILDEDGWCQGELVDEYGRRCAVGAIVKARVERGATKVFSGFETDLLMQLPMSVSLWNDQATRTKEQVQERLLLAAKTLRDRGEQL